MRLVFPNGEHGQVLLASGVNRIGSDDTVAIVLRQPGVEAAHCDIRVSGSGATLVPASGAEVQVNGKPVHELIALRSGDVLGIGPVQARIVALQAASAQAPSGHVADAPSAETDATRIRPAVPRLVLRGVTTPVFGKVFPLHGPQVLGRAPDCDLPIESDEVSRRHARLVPKTDSVLVEDLGSANGTYIDGRRIENAELRPGQELRLDSVRFLLVAPGQARASHAPVAGPMPTAPRWRGLAITLVVVSLLLIGALVMGRTL